MPSVKAILPERVKNILQMVLGKSHKRPPGRLSGFKEFCPGPPDKRALVSYLVSPLLPPATKRDRVVFSNLGIAQYIPRSLNELGYEVDIVSWDDMERLPDHRYDLFIGHGGINFEQISRALPGDTTQIYFSSGIYWREFNIREARRIYKLALRRGFLLPPDRAIEFSEEYANKIADGIICLGNEKAVQSYRQFPLVIGIHNAVFPHDYPKLNEKDFNKSRQHFLFFSGPGNVHKGLDLLLEAFVGTELHLHICQFIESEFARVYRDELTQHTNIHVCGHIRLRSADFEQLASLCNWIISATACEGQPGSVLECMAYGLIPVLPSAANIDLGKFGILLPEDGVADIKNTILTAANLDAEECRQRASLTVEEIRDNYSAEKFNVDFKQAVQKIVLRKKAGRLNNPP